MEVETLEQHRWLQQLVGEWTMAGEGDMGPGQPPFKSQGTESVIALGDLWIVGEAVGNMPGGGDAQMRLTLGYDPAQQAFVGSWVGSMATHMWVYKGQLDAAKKVLTLDTEGPSMAGDGTNMRYQDVITLVDANTRTLHSQTLGADGQWTRFMTATYQRQ
ncbi:DUF1579 domain-containing protein [Pseudorhodoferax sp. Leaf267]|uniref:DUF1579 domain-containing protein n=1 Tax=Pseudorhodoferax sp. Leaf267 TaxID=1736316 RepID=UPI0007016C85|nr:DUF1579 domain-containing protein [Pseudorhodoferax sp. Leaf267]KQP21508.1 hypothetical protein ASF43_26440 [Pseudorhodoferax sp. Leaf267]